MPDCDGRLAGSVNFILPTSLRRERIHHCLLIARDRRRRQPLDRDGHAILDGNVVGIPEDLPKGTVVFARRGPERTTSAGVLVGAQPQQLPSPEIEAGSGHRTVGETGQADIGQLTLVGVDVEEVGGPVGGDGGVVRRGDERRVGVGDFVERVSGRGGNPWTDYDKS